MCGKNSTVELASGLIGALPPLHDLTKNVGIQLPEYMGKLTGDPERMAQLGDHLKTAAKSAADQRNNVHSVLSKRVDLLTSFDKNKDSMIDASELSTAVDTALAWARASKDSKSNWYYYENKKTAGPVSWDGLIAKLKKKPLSFVSMGKSNLWLPLEAILTALK